MTTLTREQLLAVATELPTVEVDIPAWGGVIRFRGLRLSEKLVLQAAVNAAAAADDLERILKLQVAVVTTTMLQPDGSPMFEEDDLESVGKFKPDGFSAALDAVQKLNGFGPKQLTEGEEDPLSDSVATT